MAGRFGYFGISWMALALVVTQPVAHAGECPCNADVNNNGARDVVDGGIVSNCANNGGGMDCPNCVNSCDVDCNGTVDRTDFSMVYCQQILGVDADCCNLPVGACTGLAESVHGWCAMYHEAVCAEYSSSTYHGDDVSCETLLPSLQPNPDGFNRARFITFRIHPEMATGTNTAIRVELTSIATPPGAPAGTQVRFVNAVGFNGSNHGAMSIDCGDAPAHCPNFACAVLGCEPEYRDWAGEIAAIDPTDSVIHVTGNAVVPSSMYSVIFESKAGTQSSPLQVQTGVWGDVVPPFGVVNVTDFSAVRDWLLEISGAPCKSRAWMRSPPNPFSDVNVIDCANLGNVLAGFTNYSGPAIPVCP